MKHFWRVKNSKGVVIINETDEIRSLIGQLNKYRDAYYNEQNSLISDYEYDNLYDKLKSLEDKTGIVYSNSPTQSVGYEVKSNLQKVKHNHPMLSLDKTKSVQDLKDFIGDKLCVMMLKMDGLTVSLRYVDGELVSAETRGNGEIGEDVLHTARTFVNIPLTIPVKEELIVDGEAIIDTDTFNKINAKLPDDQEYKNPRNLVSGSVRQLDAAVAAERGIKFIAWKCVKGFYHNDFIRRLIDLEGIGFEVVPSITIDLTSDLNQCIADAKSFAKQKGYPIDGLVIGYRNVSYGESLGQTGHHLRSQLAFKFYDEEAETVLRDIEWSMGKTGDLTPVAVFDDVDLEGTTVNRASLHNISICENLQIGIGDEITVYKANQIIPQVRESLTKSGKLNIPKKCPICGGETAIVKEKDSKVLQCTNPDCRGKLLGKLTHAVSRNALNIDGLSDSTIEKLYNAGVIRSITDFYHLDSTADVIAKLDGMGRKSVDNLLVNIEKSRKITLDRFIYALSIPLIGRTASKAIATWFAYDYQRFITEVPTAQWKNLPDFGDAMNKSLIQFFENYLEDIKELGKEFEFVKPDGADSQPLKNITFVVTGALNKFENRESLKEEIERLGGKVSGSISGKTSYLINNDITSKSSKNKKAHQLHIPIITEDELITMMKGDNNETV